MLRRTLSLVTASVVAVAAATSLAPSPALASDSDHVAYTDESSSIGSSAYQGGYLHFVEHGDYVTLCDNDADGWQVYLDVLVGNTWKYTLGASGVGNCDYADAGDGFSGHNLPENTSITFSMYLYNASTGGDITGGVVKTWYNDY